MAFKMKGPVFFKSALKNYKDTTEYKAFQGGNEAGSTFKQKTNAPKGDAETGYGGPKFPDVVYKADGTAKLTSQIDEEMLDVKPSVGPKGKFVNYTNEDGTKIKYYYKKP